MEALSASDLRACLDDGRREIESALESVLPAGEAVPDVLRRAMRYTLLLPGKRLRPILTLQSCDMLRGRREVAMPLACAVEMIHAASLILDDLPSQDDASLRRGQPTLHRVVGEANATLASVALLNHAFGVVQDTPGLRDRGRSDAVRLLSAAVGADGLIAGQVADLESTARSVGLDDLEYIHSHKTGALFIAAVELGAVAAGARPRDHEALAGFAKNLGLAFQITDDILDVTGDPTTTGKDAGLDRDHTTFVDLCGVDGARRLVDELIDTSVAFLQAFGRRARVLRGMAEFVRRRDR